MKKVKSNLTAAQQSIIDTMTAQFTKINAEADANESEITQMIDSAINKKEEREKAKQLSAHVANTLTIERMQSLYDKMNIVFSKYKDLMNVTFEPQNRQIKVKITQSIYGSESEMSKMRIKAIVHADYNKVQNFEGSLYKGIVVDKPYTQSMHNQTNEEIIKYVAQFYIDCVKIQVPQPA